MRLDLLHPERLQLSDLPYEKSQILQKYMNLRDRPNCTSFALSVKTFSDIIEEVLVAS